LKRGFTYFKHERRERYRVAPDRGNRLLVAASPSDELSDTHWLRADVDHFLVREAIDLGVDYLDEVALDGITLGADAAVLSGRRHGAPIHVRASFVVDASGPRGFLSRALGIEARGFDGYPPTQALFSHFADVPRCDDIRDFESAGDVPPYPIDDAALHHVFDGGWMWVLRFGNGVTSAGIAVDDRLAQELRLSDGEPAWRRFLAMHPSIADQFVSARAIREFAWMPRVAYRASIAAGDRWAMLPSAAAFIDPLFSTGIPMTLLGIERLAEKMGSGLILRSTKNESRPHYGTVTLAEADHTARFVAGCYAAFPRFEMFTAYSMFYFAAASFSEMARRLNADVTRGFLGAADVDFSRAMTRLSPATPLSCDASHYAREIAAACEPLNIAGLCDPSKHNSYGIDLEDTVRSAAKLGLSSEHVREALSLMIGTVAR
jgi:FADH2 O2-dependent halogenase